MLPDIASVHWVVSSGVDTGNHLTPVVLWPQGSVSSVVESEIVTVLSCAKLTLPLQSPAPVTLSLGHHQSLDYFKQASIIKSIISNILQLHCFIVSHSTQHPGDQSWWAWRPWLWWMMMMMLIWINIRISTFKISIYLNMNLSEKYFP